MKVLPPFTLTTNDPKEIERAVNDFAQGLQTIINQVEAESRRQREELERRLVVKFWD